MNKIIATLGLAIMATSIAGSALALNPQPLPPGEHRMHGPILTHRSHHHHPVVRRHGHDHRK